MKGKKKPSQVFDQIKISSYLIHAGPTCLYLI